MTEWRRHWRIDNLALWEKKQPTLAPLRIRLAGLILGAIEGAGRGGIGGDIDATLTPDGKQLLRANREHHSELWDMPPSRPLRCLIPAWITWTLPFVLIGAWKWHKKRSTVKKAMTET